MAGRHATAAAVLFGFVAAWRFAAPGDPAMASATQTTEAVWPWPTTEGTVGERPATEFSLEHATVASINAAFDVGALTAERLVALYLARIAAYEDVGPRINAFITLHPDPLAVARALDEERRRTGPRSPLHGIPVVLKDNFNTSDLPTTGGSVSMRDVRPAREAFVVKRLRAAGAIILGKTNLTEMVHGGLDTSLGGRTSNPWDVTRTPGESSSGTGAALAANFAPLGLGSDNGQSIRSPASATGVVGIKTTIGLVSCAGVLPSSLSHNSCGPMARSVADIAYLLDAIAGFDPEDFLTRLSLARIPATYTRYLDADGLRGARLGVLVELKGQDPEHAEVNRVFDAAVARMEALGATMLPVVIPDMDDFRGIGTDRYEAWDLLNRWFAELGPTSPFRDMDDFLERGTYNPLVLPRARRRQAHSGAEHLPAYHRALIRMHEFRDLLVALLDEHSLDALVYPLQQVLVAEHGQANRQRNGFVASFAMLPAIDVPAGYSAPLPSAPAGVPIGLDFLGRPFDEGRLLRLAFAWEQRGLERRSPPHTPPLAEEQITAREARSP